MKPYVNKDALSEILADKTGLQKKQMEEILDKTLEEIIQILKDGRDVKLTGFGTFTTRIRESRGGVNPRNPSERIQVPTVRVVKFKAGTVLKKLLKDNNPTTT